MRFMILVKATKDSEAGAMPPESLFAEMGRYHEELQKAGMLLDASGLKPSNRGWRIQYDGKKRSFVDGPFAETKEVLAGFWVIRAKSRQEAVEWMMRAPFPAGTTLELRQVFDPEDFAASDPTGELRRKEEELRKRVESRG